MSILNRIEKWWKKSPLKFRFLVETNYDPIKEKRKISKHVKPDRVTHRSGRSDRVKFRKHLRARVFKKHPELAKS